MSAQTASTDSSGRRRPPSRQKSLSPAPAGSESTTAGAGPPPAPKSDGIRDTIEAIVVAFILAFVFRAFVVEAFVIPTGSMAPTLYGLHGEHRCSLCQYPFAYGIRERARLAEGAVQPGTLDIAGGFAVRCPNCGWSGPGNKDLNENERSRVITNGGDRILVLKWPYDIGAGSLGPQRWDVVVFRDPQNGEQNFIKRLLGLPGEVFEIINGDVYTAPIDIVPPDILEALSKKPLPPPHGHPQSRRLTEQQSARLAQLLKIRRKTRIAQESLWLIHYDHDYKPDLTQAHGNPDFNPPRWLPQDQAAQAAWDASSPRVRFRPYDDREHWLRLVGKPIQDTYGYNSVNYTPTRQKPCPVGDVRLRFALTPGGYEGYLILLLTKGPDAFRARIDADGTVQLERTREDGVTIPLGTARIDPLQAGRPITVQFQNVDYRVALSVDDTEVLATDDAQYRPDVGKLLQGSYQDGRFCTASVAIGARGLPLEIRHLTVHRDVFYRSDVLLDRVNLTNGRHNPYVDYPGWGTANNPILLRADPPDFFCCGDNSPQSKDSRLWWEVCPMLDERGDYQFGTVPGDQMIGRAFFVYWPGGYRLSRDTPALIPNVGRMRIIR